MSRLPEYRASRASRDVHRFREQMYAAWFEEFAEAPKHGLAGRDANGDEPYRTAEEYELLVRAAGLTRRVSWCFWISARIVLTCFSDFKFGFDTTQDNTQVISAWVDTTGKG